ncbi:hypothetical protein [Micromonospora sp. NPDC092111]|uniref:hypothetical protein n=1 Tax=Micromonospora sp. NPDC092111 TaxID=3364289 RepID=UPI003815D4B4
MEHLISLEDEFIAFVENRYAENSFCDMLDYWAEFGNAVEYTAGDFTLWVQTIFYLRESPRTAVALDRNDLSLSFAKGVPDCLNPLIWNYYVSRYSSARASTTQQAKS